MDITQLGITKDEIRECVVAKIVQEFVDGYGNTSDTWTMAGVNLQDEIYDKCQQAIKAKVDDLAGQQIIPTINTYIDNLRLQATNTWGEKKGEQVSIVEYIAKCAESYMHEKVDYSGKTKSESHSSSWSPMQTRLAYAIDQYLSLHIREVMKQMVKNGNETLTDTLKKSLQISLDKIKKNICITVKAD